MWRYMNYSVRCRGDVVQNMMQSLTTTMLLQEENLKMQQALNMGTLSIFDQESGQWIFKIP